MYHLAVKDIHLLHLIHLLLCLTNDQLFLTSKFVAAIDEADRDRTPKQTLPGRQLTNPQEILALMSKKGRKNMSDKYFTVNIRAYLDKDEPTYIGEESLYDLLSDFSCPKNPDVEYFLLHNAIEFTKKDQSITYLVFDAEDASLVGYFSLTIKPISVRASNISKTMAKKLSRVSILMMKTQSYTTAAFLPPTGNILLGFWKPGGLQRQLLKFI